MARGILRQAERDAIFRDEPILLSSSFQDDELHTPVGGSNVIPLFGPEEQELPDHDWTQHDLGDEEDWANEDAHHLHQAAVGEFTTPAPNTDEMQDTGTELGTHHAQVYQHPQTKENWLVKKAPKSASFLAAGDVAASAIQQHSGLDTPPTFLNKVDGGPASVQLMYPHAKDAYPNKQFDPEKVNDEDLMTIQKHQALDWLIGNHDAHGGQFIRDQQGKLIGIDKGQAFKHYSQDQLHWNHHPNNAYDEAEPVYNTLYRNFAKGGREVNDPRQGELGQFIQNLQGIPDDELRNTLTPYATGAAQSGMLANQFDSNKYPGLNPTPRFAKNDPKAFLDAVVARKNNLMNDMGELHDRAMAHRMTGTKIAWRREGNDSRTAAVPDWERKHINRNTATDVNNEVHDLKWGGGKGYSHGEQSSGLTPTCSCGWSSGAGSEAAGRRGFTHHIKSIGKTARLFLADQPNPEQLHHDKGAGELGTHGAQVWHDPQGKWLLKKPSPGAEFMVPLDLATSRLQREVGLDAPETYAVPHQGGVATAAKMYPNATMPWDQRSGQKPPRLPDLSPQDLDTVQKHQALDWLIGNHDAHDGNWLRTQEGNLVGIDKGQAMKYFGRDRLDPDFHPNYYARPPIYNQLWKDHMAGQGQMQDPRQGSLGEFVNRLQSIPDHHLREMFHPYAAAAKNQRALGTGGPYDPQRKLSPPSTVQPNDTKSFLDTMVARKNNLHNDLGALYDKATAVRNSTSPTFQPFTDTGSDSMHEGAIHREGTPSLTSLVPALSAPLTALSPPTGTPTLPKTPALPTPPAAPTTQQTPASPGVQQGAQPTLPKPNYSQNALPSLMQPGFNGVPFAKLEPESVTSAEMAEHPNGGGSGGGATSPAPGTSPSTTPGATPSGGTALPAGGGVPLVKNPDGSYTSSDPAWAHLINRESGGRNIIQAPSTKDVNTGGNEAFGIFQITPGTWTAHGGQGSVYNSTPEQQAQVAADIFRKNPSGSDWGAGLTGREDAAGLAAGIGHTP
jgi:hypothetical protein